MGRPHEIDRAVVECLLKRVSLTIFHGLLNSFVIWSAGSPGLVK